jgi:hypothetical protein
MLDMRADLEANFAQLRSRLEAMLTSGHTPLFFLDLDDTMNRGLGTLIEAPVVAALRELAQVGVVLGLNTGADISWAGERILCETDQHFVFPFMLLAAGRQIYAWAESLRAYALLPITAQGKGQAMHALAEYLELPLEQFAFIADFPGTGNQQESIDDSVLREPIGIVINVGGLRPPEELTCSCTTTLLVHPPQREQQIGCGYTATALYLACLAETLTRAGYSAQATRLRAELLHTIERKVGIHISRDHPCQRWTFEQRVHEVPRTQPICIRAQSAGLVHAGVNMDGRWLRIYDFRCTADEVTDSHHCWSEPQETSSHRRDFGTVGQW